VKIAFSVKNNEFWNEGIEKIKSDFPMHDFLMVKENSDEFYDSDLAVAVRMKSETLEKTSKLKAIFVPFAGINQFPLRDIAEKGIKLSNTHWNAPYVAERALTLSLSVLGRVVEFHDKLKQGVWGGFLAQYEENINWISLRKKKISIIGLGNIGIELARLLKPFGCDVLGFKRKTDTELPEGVNRITADLNEALEFADVIYMILPLTKNTRSIINESNKHLLKGKFLINVGRGKTVDEDTLFSLIKDNILKGAGIDVWYSYPFEKELIHPSKNPIHLLPNIVISPHCASDAYEGEAEGVRKTLENISIYLNTGEIPDLVDLNEGY